MFDLGIIGGGQLARMSIHAAQRLGLTCVSLDPGSSTPASAVASSQTGDLNDPQALAGLIRSSRRLGLENEFVPALALREAFRIAGRSEEDLAIPLDSLALIQDKLLQREALKKWGVPTPDAAALDGRVPELPFVAKARFGGYDGKGTVVIRSDEDLNEHSHRWQNGGWLGESFVPFRRELAVMVLRTSTQTLTMEVVESQQRDFVCDVTYPARLWHSEVNTAGVPEAAVEAIGGFGLFGVELFELENGEVLVNEIAPRPHNTGHYSLDWGDLSQFDLHVRTALGLPLPTPSDGRLKGRPVYMANLLGQEGARDFRKGVEAAIAVEPSARIHWYGKAESRPGRKMGHLNLVARHEEPPHTLLPYLERIRAAFYDGWVS